MIRPWSYWVFEAERDQYKEIYQVLPKSYTKRGYDKDFIPIMTVWANDRDLVYQYSNGVGEIDHIHPADLKPRKPEAMPFRDHTPIAKEDIPFIMLRELDD